MKNDDKATFMFEMTLDVAEEFYTRCIETHAETQKEKTDILVDLANEGKIKRIIKTGRTFEKVAEDLSKNFGNVIAIKAKGDKK